MKKQNDDFVIDETGYVPPAVLAKMKKKKEERQKQVGKVKKVR